MRRQLVAKALLSKNDVTSSLEHYEPEHAARQLLIDRGRQRSTKGGGILSEFSPHVIRGCSDALHAMIRRRWKPIRGLVRLRTPVRPPDSNELRPVGP